MYSTYNSNIKYIGSTIKCIGFELIDYVINLNVVLLFMILVILILCLYQCITSLSQ